MQLVYVNTRDLICEFGQSGTLELHTNISSLKFALTFHSNRLLYTRACFGKQGPSSLFWGAWRRVSVAAWLWKRHASKQNNYLLFFHV